jgi:predicted nucleic acid-binding protein
MHFFYVDASALAKRYTPELGSPVVDHLFAKVTSDRFYVLGLGIAEVVSLLVRQKNSGKLDATTYTQALVNFRAEILAPAVVHVVEAETGLILAGLPLIETHAINATDSVILRSALDLAANHRTTGDELVLASSDQRLLRAGQAEGLVTFNPEVQSETDLDALLTPGSGAAP